MISPRVARRLPLIPAALAVALAFIGGCGDDASDVGGDAPTAGGELSADAAAGQQVAKESGCAGCHGADFSGSLGPSWVGLHGSTVMLDDGSTVVADDAYLTTAIEDPAAQKVADYALAMPENQLSPDQVAQIVAYIRELGPADG